MEIRKVQRTAGDMHYVYLPTSWCKKHNIDSKTKVNIDEDSSGRLNIYPDEKSTKRDSHLNISISEENQEVIHKLIMACYINPLSSFQVKLDKDIDYTRLLNQKKIISLESVEIDRNIISSDSSVMLTDPDLLLITMVKKIRNLLLVMIKDYDSELINRYEEEIDRSKMLIEKSIISFMTLTTPMKLKTIDLYYISLISRDLERFVDHLIKLEKSDKEYLKQIIESMDILKEIMDSLKKNKANPEYKKALDFVRKVASIENIKVKDVKHYDKRRIKGLLSSVSEVLIDWAITKEIR
ncbi:PhoU domain-containing protein [Candidatus Woesearchaeota archaeon]|nr:PhoU domain-containing protein [Candidatus Woesearchaeota archaeon]